MSRRGGEDRSGAAAVDQRLNVAVASIRRNLETGNAVGISRQAVVDTADGAAGGGIEDELPVLDHQTAG